MLEILEAKLVTFFELLVPTLVATYDTKIVQKRVNQGRSCLKDKLLAIHAMMKAPKLLMHVVILVCNAYIWQTTINFRPVTQEPIW